MAAAIARIRQPRHTSIVLIGHSGGGVLAALLESRVDDVVGVISIGANLDIDRWTELHEYDPLSGSLNPIAQTKEENIPHLQLVGGRDTKVPLEISSHYSQLKSNVNLVVYRDFDHVCCWEKEWPAILAKFSAERINAAASFEFQQRQRAPQAVQKRPWQRYRSSLGYPDLVAVGKGRKAPSPRQGRNGELLFVSS